MQINLKGTELTLTPALKVYVESKLGSLAKFIKQFEKEGETEMRVEIARTTRHHHRGPSVFRAEANLRLPGRVLRANQDDADARAAIDKVKDKLQLEIEKYKTRLEKRSRGQK